MLNKWNSDNAARVGMNAGNVNQGRQSAGYTWPSSGKKRPWQRRAADACRRDAGS